MLGIVGMGFCVVDDSLADDDDRVRKLLELLIFGVGTGQSICRQKADVGNRHWLCLSRTLALSPRLAPPVVSQLIEVAVAGHAGNSGFEIGANAGIAQDREVGGKADAGTGGVADRFRQERREFRGAGCVLQENGPRPCGDGNVLAKVGGQTR